MSGRAPLDTEALTMLAAPSDADVEQALGRFVSAAKAHYGAKLDGVYLFGSRARGDHRPDSDADVAVVLVDGDWIDWRERSVLVGLAYEPSLDSGLLIQPWPVAASVWNEDRHDRPAFIRTALRDARPVGRAT